MPGNQFQVAVKSITWTSLGQRQRTAVLLPVVDGQVAPEALVGVGRGTSPLALAQAARANVGDGNLAGVCHLPVQHSLFRCRGQFQQHRAIAQVCVCQNASCVVVGREKSMSGVDRASFRQNVTVLNAQACERAAPYAKEHDDRL